MYRYLQTLEPTDFSARERGSVSAMSQPNPLLALSTQQATWLFFRKEEDLKAEEQQTLGQLRQASPHLETAYQLVKEFLHMVADAHRGQA
jgi:ferric-dicitrate binding protein FerR (iron transport regulator)